MEDEDQAIPAMRNLWKHVTAAEADDVVVSGNGEDVLHYMFGTGSYGARDSNATPEFVLLDVQLPKLNGLQVLERLRDGGQTHLVPVILSSNEHEHVVEGFVLGTESCVTKSEDLSPWFQPSAPAPLKPHFKPGVARSRRPRSGPARRS